MQLGFIFILIVSIFIAIFAIQNGNPVPVDLFLARYEMPLAVVMMACLIIGAVLVLILGTFRQVKKISESKELKNKIKVSDSEKVQFENNIKTMETEIKALKENNNVLSSKVSELESKNNEQSQTIVKLTEEIKENNIKLEAEIVEGAGSGLYNEKSEANSE